MSGNNEKLKWLEFLIPLFIFSLLSSAVFADNSTDYIEDDMEDVLIIQPAPPVIPQCRANEVYQSCEVDCINCEQRGMCEPQNCHIAHCDCKMYFVHVTANGPCEHVSVCPPRECPENEVYRHCGPLCEGCDMSPCRKMECSSRCYCKEGYRRNRETGECVPEKECPERLNCVSNDVVAESGPFSDHCMLTQSETLRANETIEDKKCYCETGFKRNIHGWCIEESACTYVECFEGTEFQDCPRKCNTTCWNYGDSKCVEDGQCYPACFCKEGYVLNEFFSCIPVETCPPGSNPLAAPLPPPTIGPIPEPALEETGNSSAIATTEDSSAAAAESISVTESSSAEAESSPGKDSSSAAAAESSSGSESSAAEAESSSTKTTESEAGTESSADTEKSKETKAEETNPEEQTTEPPKKPPKKAKGGKIYKSAARPGKTVSASSDASSSSSSKSSAATEEEEKA